MLRPYDWRGALAGFFCWLHRTIAIVVATQEGATLREKTLGEFRWNSRKSNSLRNADLLLDALAELLGVGDHNEGLGCAAGAAHDDRAVA
jgi:hypothetical protein